MKIRGFEFEDQTWFPEMFRDWMTGYLRFLFVIFRLYQPVLPLLKEALVKSNTNKILDLCSGSGGTMESIYENLKLTFDANVQIFLSDLYPNMLIYRYLETKTEKGISFISKPVDAINVPSEANGFRTIFSGFHHFDHETAKKVLQNAVDARQGIGIFDGGNKSVWMVLVIIIIHPLLLFLCTPFFRPFSISRLLFTYLVPVIPFCTVWDGVFSIVRLYQPKELLQMAHEVERENYTWISGKVRNKFGMSIAFLIGYPGIVLLKD
ncbi:MAG: hypothetical protein K0M40_17790 [Prolixibacteraceae bacterium]|nr:hypothetical protein [Prolixibacteraceae bacterium]